MAAVAQRGIQPLLPRLDLQEIQGITVHDDIMDYAVEIARNTRKSRYLTLGASPRAAIAPVSYTHLDVYKRQRSA